MSNNSNISSKSTTQKKIVMSPTSLVESSSTASISEASSKIINTYSK